MIVFCRLVSDLDLSWVCAASIADEGVLSSSIFHPQPLIDARRDRCGLPGQCQRSRRVIVGMRSLMKGNHLADMVRPHCIGWDPGEAWVRDCAAGRA